MVVEAELKNELNFVPRTVIALMQTIRIKATNRAYSTIEAPSSSRPNSATDSKKGDMMRIPFAGARNGTVLGVRSGGDESELHQQNPARIEIRDHPESGQGIRYAVETTRIV
jgi:hypothetical protein